MLEDEEEKPTCTHANDYQNLTDKQKGDTLVCHNFVNIATVSDFSGLTFKEVASPSRGIKQILNKDSMLDLDAVREEIFNTRQKIHDHQNADTAQYKTKGPDQLGYLGMLVDQHSEDMTLKGKPISFKSHSRGSVDTTIKTLMN